MVVCRSEVPTAILSGCCSTYREKRSDRSLTNGTAVLVIFEVAVTISLPYFFAAPIWLFGFRFWIWPLSVPAVGSMTQLISAGLPDARDSVRALVRPFVSVT